MVPDVRESQRRRHMVTVFLTADFMFKDILYMLSARFCDFGCY